MILPPSQEHLHDREVCRLLDALCEALWDRGPERIKMLRALGRLYMLLAIARQQNLNPDDLERQLVMEGEHLLGRLGVPVEPAGQSLVRDWFQEALAKFSAALGLATDTEDIGWLRAYRGLVHRLLGHSLEAQADLAVAQASSANIAQVTALWQEAWAEAASTISSDIRSSTHTLIRETQQ